MAAFLLDPQTPEPRENEAVTLNQLADQLAQKWADQLGQWGIPERILASAPESPWTHDPKAFAVDDALPTDTPSYRAAKAALKGGGTVIDVGVGGGRSSLGLGVLATHITGVDASQPMLDRFSIAATEQNTPHTTLQGNWPDVAARAGTADIVICHHVLYNVGDIIPFIRALTNAAKRRVIVEVTESHPQSRPERCVAPLSRHHQANRPNLVRRDRSHTCTEQ